MAMTKPRKLYPMKEACKQTGMAYETLKYYCNTGLIPNVKRSSNNRRVFDEHDIAWIKSLTCLKKCGMTIKEMKQYLAYCLQGPSSIPIRKISHPGRKEKRNPGIHQLYRLETKFLRRSPVRETALYQRPASGIQ